MLKVFLKNCFILLGERAGFLAVFNVLFFGAVLVSALVASFVFVPPLVEEGSVPFSNYLFGDGWALTFLVIFLSNLVLSAFLVVTLSGLIFFGLSVVFLLYRATVWGLLLAFIPLYQFLAVLPTVVLEGEAYVMAAVVGSVLGLSWLKPKWAFRGERLSRRKALVMALREGFRLYVLVAFVLFVAAVTETVTLYFFR